MPAFAFSNGQAATIVIGQTSFTSGNSGLSASMLSSPQDHAFDSSGNLWVVDDANNRVLKFTAPFSIGESASMVIGQTSFTSNVFGTTQSTFKNPTGIAFDPSGNMWIVDQGNNRVLEFTAPFSTGQLASVVIGQSNFITGTFASPPTQSSLFSPTAISFNSGYNMTIADAGNNRILIFVPTNLLANKFSNGELAGNVLGQSSFTTKMAGTTASALNNSAGVKYDGITKIWVSDYGNNRILMFNVASGISNGQPASLVLGQPDFTSNTANNGGVSASSLSSPVGLAFDSNGNLWVADEQNHRALNFTSPFNNHETASTVIGQPDFTTNTYPWATTAKSLQIPVFITLDPNGNLWINDVTKNRILMYSGSVGTSSLPIPDLSCTANPKLPSCQILNPREPDPCIVNGHLICKVNFDVFREIIRCYDQVDGPMCPPPKTMTQEILLDIKQEFPPLKQVQAGIPLKDIVAAKGNVLIMNDHRSSPASVTEKTANSLLSNPFWHKFP